jgi:hypothetical protein
MKKNEKMKNAYKTLMEVLKERDYFLDSGLDCMIILQEVLEREKRKRWEVVRTLHVKGRGNNLGKKPIAYFSLIQDGPHRKRKN